MIRTSLQIAENLDSILMPYAVKHSVGKNRPNPEPDDQFRTRFQVDRDRILHSKPFRRLKNKTQVFTPSTGDHFRDRLTHTLEVSQIARGLARTLGLNEDLSEVIALAHDLGHTPFGHAGEYALRDFLKKYNFHFEHNEQSYYLVKPLNLNFEVLEGLQKHQTPYDQATHEFVSATLEAQVVNFADEIAYQNHDLDDGIRSGILNPQDFSNLRIFKSAANTLANNLDPITDRHKIISQIMKLMIDNLILETSKRVQHFSIKTLSDVYECSHKIVQFSADFQLETQELRHYLYQNFYNHAAVTAQTKSGKKIIQALFEHYLSSPDALPQELKSRIESGENPVMIVKDYVSGMTDNFANNCYMEFKLK